MTTFIPLPNHLTALARWYGDNYLNDAQSGFIYTSGDCSCWSGKQGEFCQHLQDWLEYDSNRMMAEASRALRTAVLIRQATVKLAIPSHRKISRRVAVVTR